MSKRLLSLIKPRQNPNSKPAKIPLYEPHIKKLANEACNLLRTHQNWEKLLEPQLAEESIEASEIAHLVFDRIRDVGLGLKFYEWFSHRQYCSPLDGYAFSSLLKLLGNSRVFDEVENVLICMKIQGILPTIEAFDVLIRAYADAGLVDKARELYRFVNDRFDCLKFYEWFSHRQYCSPLDGYAFSSLLKLLGNSRVFDEVENVLICMKIQGILPTIEAFDVLIRAYADAGLVDKARELYRFVNDRFDCMPSVYACNSLLNGLVKTRRMEVAQEVYDEMLKRDGGGGRCCSDNCSTSIVVRGFCQLGKVDEGRKMIEDRWGKGCVPNVVFYNTLIDGYCRRGETARANRLLQEMNFKGFLPTVETYGPMINGFCKEGKFDEVDRVLEEMKIRGLKVNVQIHNNIIDSQYKHGCLVDPYGVIRKIKESCCKPDIMTYNILISGLCNIGKVGEANALLDQAMKRGLTPDKYSYTPFIHIYCKQGDPDKASCLLIEMTERGHRPDMVTYGALVHGLVVRGEIEAASNIRKQMIERGVIPDAGIYNVLMSGLFRKGMLSAAKQLFCEMLDQNIHPDALVYTTLVDGFSRNGNLDEAKKIFELAVEKHLDPGVVGYNAMIKAYIRLGRMNDAILCFKKMSQRRISPDIFTYSTLIDGCVKQRDLDNALRIFREMVENKHKPNVVTYTSLINGYCRQGDTFGAEKTFKEMQCHGLAPNVITYSILVGGFCKGGNLVKAVSTFEGMLINKCTPNDVTFNYLVNGFTNAVSAAISEKENGSEKHESSVFLELFKRMISDGLPPRKAVYNCILICLCHHRMRTTALQLTQKYVNRNILEESFVFVALLHGICLEGRSKEWRNLITYKLNEQEIPISLRYSKLLDMHLPKGLSPDVSFILHQLAEDCKFNSHEKEHRTASVR
ncbi:hypothetical protein SOVF_198620 [Spinacia oleracea]|nr:hypothetical protein SOVF_198620 [Spinacia oleracea]